MEYQPLKYIYRSSGIQGAQTLLMLHGTGGDENDLLKLAGFFPANVNVLSLRGNVSENGMPRFFRRIAMGVFDEEDLRFRTHELVNFVKSLAEKEAFDADRVIALGYSNGANIAGAALVLYPEWLAGAILFRAMKPIKSPGIFNTKKQQPVFISSGEQDPTIAPGEAEKYAQLLKEAGFDVTHHELNAGHNLSQQDVVLAGEWYSSNFGN